MLWSSKLRPEGETRGYSQLEGDAKVMGEGCVLGIGRNAMARNPHVGGE